MKLSTCLRHRYAGRLGHRSGPGISAAIAEPIRDAQQRDYRLRSLSCGALLVSRLAAHENKELVFAAGTKVFDRCDGRLSRRAP